jgi:hypothetical protein
MDDSRIDEARMIMAVAYEEELRKVFPSWLVVVSTQMPAISFTKRIPKRYDKPLCHVRFDPMHISVILIIDLNGQDQPKITLFEYGDPESFRGIEKTVRDFLGSN